MNDVIPPKGVDPLDEQNAVSAHIPHIAGMSLDMEDTHNSVFYAAFQTTRMPMIFTDPNQDDNPIVLANPAFLTLTGYDAEDLIGKNCRLLQGPETDQNNVSKIRSAIAEEKPIAVELLNYKKDGSSFWNALFVSPVYDKQNKLIFFFASQLDVSARRDSDDRYRQSQKMEAVGQLTGGIAHDFNNLLTVVQGYSDVLQTIITYPNPDPVKMRQAVFAILQATEKGSKLTGQLLSFARKQKLEGRVINFRDLVNHLIPLIEKSVGEGVEIDVSHHGSNFNCRIDPLQAEMAIINIAVNARDAMNGQGNLEISTGSVEVTSSNTLFGNIPHGRYVTLDIRDNGSGMSPETLEKITEPFFTTKGEGKGTGLGMATVYGFVTQSEGAMKVESEEGVGTTVHLLFKQEDDAAEQKHVKAEKILVGAKNDKETILVVEDRVEVGDFVTFMLQEYGYNLFRAKNADEALKIFETGEKIDLLFSDISMPGEINGVQLSRIVNECYPDTKILLTTGYIESDMEITDLNGVPFELIRKPYRQTDIINKLRAVIDGPDGVS